MSVDFEQLRRVEELAYRTADVLTSNPIVTRRGLGQSFLFLATLLTGCSSQPSIKSIYDVTDIDGRTQVLQEGNIETGKLIVNINAGALSLNQAVIKEIVNPPFRGRVIFDTRPQPGIAMQVALGLTSEAMTRLNVLPRIANVDLSQPHNFQLEWRQWKLEQASWDGKLIKEFADGRNIRQRLTPLSDP